MPRLATAGLALIVLVAATAHGYNNGVARLPPMGWNTWCTDDLCGAIDRCSDAEIRTQAKALVTSGMVDLGYRYVNMDDCWAAKGRDAEGNMQPNAERFPFGMKALADYVHSLGLGIGVYTCVGTKTCRNGLPGSFGHYEQDARQLASWGIDFVKADNCHRPKGYSELELYTNFSRALNATGRPIVFSLCEWGDQDVEGWGGDVGQMFRVQQDHLPFWWFPGTAAGRGFGQGVINIVEYVATLRPSSFVRPFAWLDPDFLMTLFLDGRTSMTYPHSKVEFTMWSMWSAPLIVATHVDKMDAAKRSILMNTEVIAVDQDALAIAGDVVINATEQNCQVWTKPLSNGDVAVAVVNGRFRGWKAPPAVNQTLAWAALGLQHVSAVRDMWAHRSAAFNARGITVGVASEDVTALRVSCVPRCHNFTSVSP